jgi:hypothetical protein
MMLSKNVEKSYKIDPKELSLGIKKEMEHTNSTSEARKIAIDHLKANPKYYSKLKKAGL